MRDYQYRQDLFEVLTSADTVLIYLAGAKEFLDKADDWSKIDMFGGAIITSAIKHKQIKEAQSNMEKAEKAIDTFKKELQDILVIKDFDLELTADIVITDIIFDNVFTDSIIQDQIDHAQFQVNYAIEQIRKIREEILQYDREKYGEINE